MNYYIVSLARVILLGKIMNCYLVSIAGANLTIILLGKIMNYYLVSLAGPNLTIIQLGKIILPCVPHQGSLQHHNTG